MSKTPSRPILLAFSLQDHHFILPSQTWKTCLANHAHQIASIDFSLFHHSASATCTTRAEFADARIAIPTTYKGDAEIQQALEAGARGYLLKSMSPKHLVNAIRQIHQGKKWILAEPGSPAR